MRAAPPLQAIAGVDRAVALLRYQGPARELVARAKFRNERTGLRWLALGMAELVCAWQFDTVTWAPANPRHVRTRGFDHGERLATLVAQHTTRPVASTLRRGSGAALTGQSARQRVGGPPLSSRHTDRAWPLLGQTVLLVDDVVTTGATLSAAAAQLRAQGATAVLAVVAAFTPAPSTRA